MIHSESPAPDCLDRLARFVGQTPADAISEAVLARTREILVDTFSVIAWGMRTPGLVALSGRPGTGLPGREI